MSGTMLRKLFYLFIIHFILIWLKPSSKLQNIGLINAENNEIICYNKYLIKYK